MADIQSNIKFNIDTADAMASIKALQAQISAFQTQMSRGSSAQVKEAKNLQRTLIDNVNATGKFNASLTTIKTTTESFTHSLEKNKLSMREYFRYAGGASKSFGKFFKAEFDTIGKVARERVKDLQTQYIQLGRDANGAMQAIKVRPLVLDLENLQTKTAIAAQKQALLNQLLKQGSTNLLNFGKNTQWAGRQLMVGFTIPLGIMGSAAAKSFMEMEQATIKFQRVYGDLSTTIKESDEMVGTIKTLASEFTKYGVSFKDTMSLAADAAAMGKTGSDLIQQVTETNRLAVLGNVEQGAALQTTTSLMDAFGTSAENLGSKINFLNAVENQTITSIEDLTTAIPKAGPVIKQLGGSVEDLAFFLTAMREGGINASEGANALKSGLASLINPTQKASDFLARFKVNITEIVESNKGDVKGLVLDFAEALKTLDPLNRARAIEQLFGKFQFARMSTLFQNVIAEGSQASKVLELTNATATELGMLAGREMKKLADSPMYKFQKAVADIQAQLAPVGEEFLKAITPIVEFGTKILDWFNGLESGTKQFIVNLVGIVGGIGPIFLMTFGLLANGAANIIKLFALMKNGFNKLGGSSKDLASQTQYMTNEQIEAAAIASSLDQAHNKLRQTFTLEAGALNQLTAAYQRNIAASGMRPVIPGKKFATGGMVSGAGNGTSDSIPALLSNGEYVVNAKATKQALPLLEGINSGKIAKFAYGGRADKRKSVPTDFSVSGGNYEQKRYSKLAFFGPGNTPTGYGIDTDWLKNTEDAVDSWQGSLIAGTRSSMKSKGKISSFIDKMLPQFEGVFNELLSVYRSGVDNAKDVVELGKNTYPQMKKQLSEAVKSGKITAREAGHINNALRAMVNPRKSDYTEYTAAPRYEGGFDEFGNPTYKRAGVGEREGRTLRSGAKTATGYIRGIRGRGPVPKEYTYAHLSASMSDGTVYQEPRIRTATSARAKEIAAGTAKSLAADIPISQGKVFIDQQGFARSRQSGVDAGTKALDSFNQGLAEAAQTASPSRRTRKTAEDVVEGFDNGLRSGVDDAKVAGQTLANATIGGVSGTARRAQDPGGSTSPIVAPSGRQSGGRRVSVPGDLEARQAAEAAAMASSGNALSGKTNKQMKAARRQVAYNQIKSGKRNIGGKISGGGFAAAGVSAVASMVAPPEMQGMLGTITTVLSMVGMFGNVIGKIVPMLLRFAGPIGIAITAITAVAWIFGEIDKAAKERIKNEKALNNAVKMSAEGIKGAADFFGITAKERIGSKAGVSTTAVTGGRASIANDLLQNTDFKKQNAAQIDALKRLKGADVDRALAGMAADFSSLGFGEEAVQAMVDAMVIAAGKKNVSLDFKSINVNTKKGRVGQQREVQKILDEQLAKVSQGPTTQVISNTSGNMDFGTKVVTQFKRTKEEMRALYDAGKLVANQFSSLQEAFNDGTIDLKTYSSQFSNLTKKLKEIPNTANRFTVMQSAIKALSPEMAKFTTKIKDSATQAKILQAAMLGLTIPSTLLKSIEAGQDSLERRYGIDPRKTLQKMIDDALAAQKLLNDAFVTPTDPGNGDGTTKEDKIQARLRLIEIQEERINKKYDERRQALEQVKSIQEQISAQQREQLDLADALTRGDIAGAARAAQQMRASNATRAIEDQQKALDASQKAEVGALVDPLGKRSKSYLENVVQQQEIQGLYKTIGMKAPKFGEPVAPSAKVPTNSSGQSVINNVNNSSPVYNINVSTNSNASPAEIATIVIDKIKSTNSQQLKGSRFE